jgi:hypothetical protein
LKRNQVDRRLRCGIGGGAVVVPGASYIGAIGMASAVRVLVVASFAGCDIS